MKRTYRLQTVDLELLWWDVHVRRMVCVTCRVHSRWSRGSQRVEEWALRHDAAVHRGQAGAAASGLTA